jgi:hypothetical protein
MGSHIPNYGGNLGKNISFKEVRRLEFTARKKGAGSCKSSSSAPIKIKSMS